MRYGLLVLLICLGIAFDLGVYLAASDDLFESFDPLHPATLLPIVANRFRELQPQVREVLRNLLDELAAPYREQLKRRIPTDPLPE